MVARIATLRLKIPVLMTYHGSEPELVPQVGFVARHSADITISPSHTTTLALQERGGVPLNRTRVIGLGIKPLPKADAQEIRKFRVDNGCEESDILVCSLSRLSHQKGIDIMIEVVRRVVSTRQDVKFVVAGGGPLSEEVEEWARTAGLLEHIRFIGHTDNSALLLRASDIYLLTSRWEALPISIVEAFRAGLPVIATDCGGVRELVAETVGRLCAVEDVEALSEAILELAADEDLRRELSENALALSYEDRFTPEHVNRTFEATYAEVIEKGFQQAS